MDKNKILTLIVGLMIYMVVANNLAWDFHWYYSIWWYDVMMHCLGGVWLGFFFSYGLGGYQSVVKRFLLVISLVLIVGILWEFFEYYLNIISTENFKLDDTLEDLICDTLGGVAAYLYVFRRAVFKTNGRI